MLLKFYTAFVAALLIFPHSGRPQDTENVDTVSNDDASKATDAAHSTFDLVSRDSAGVENGDAGTTFNMTILHTNDIHSRILESTKRGVQCNDRQRNKSECYGGVARIANEVRKLKNLTQNPLFLNAGDFFQGTLWYSILKYNIVAAVMANMSYDTVCLGNHEFDDGPAGLVPFLVKMKEANVTVLGTNLDTSKEPLFAQENITLPKSIIYNISGTQVALLGVVTTETMTIAKPGGVVILSEADSINAEIARLKNESRVDIFILISHVGFDVDQILAEKCPDLDLIVGGHTNTFLYTGDPPVKDKPEGPYPYIHNRTNGGRCLIVQDYRFGKYLGYLELEIDRTSGNITRWSGNPILLNQSYTEDEEMLESLQPYKKIVDDAVKEVVGSTKVLLEANDKLCRYKECNAVNLMADAFFDYYTNRDSMVKNAWSIVNAAVLNGGIARDSIEQKGNVTLGDVLGAMPYDSDLVVMNMTGRDLLNMFEFGVTNFTWLPDLNGRFLQGSGIRVIYNFSMPSGCRIMSLKVLCANCSIPVYNEVMENETYSIVTTTFIANGGDGFKFERTVKWKTEGVSATDALLAYIKKISPIKTPEEGRVITLDLPPKPENTTTSSPIAQPSTTADNSAVTMASVMSLNEWRSMRRNYLW
ncbi:protein 5NUC-like isoform X1 [Dermacentor silvarum]|uniref:protein 5NUC-like isoform X1 n=1 Tax=Dermacentor silvarum TaxID=543639 RepID=UPI001899319D|nr:protein 5NUC-like isoform X1 [Dermacentor silvarum]